MEEAYFIVEQGRLPKLRQLLEEQEDWLNKGLLWGRTPAIVACIGNRTQLLQLLISRGADLTIRDNSGFDCLDWANRVKAGGCCALVIKSGQVAERPSIHFCDPIRVKDVAQLWTVHPSLLTAHLRTHPNQLGLFDRSLLHWAVIYRDEQTYALLSSLLPRPDVFGRLPLDYNTLSGGADDSIHDVIVVGAGASGLSAAYALSQSCKVLVLEGRHRPGGRLHRQQMGSTWLDEGGHWVHNCTQSHQLLQEVRRLGLPITDFDAPQLVMDQSTGKPVPPPVLEVAEQWAKRVWEEAAQNDPNQELSVAQAATQVFEDVDLYLNSEQKRAFFETVSLRQNHQASNIEKLSAYWMVNASDPKSDKVIEGGYAVFLQQIAKKVLLNASFQYGKTIIKINYERDIIEVDCADGSCYFSKRIVVSLPLGILKKQTVAFNPPLSDEKLRSIKNLGFGLMNKVALRFNKRFWGQHTAVIRTVPKQKFTPPIFFDNSTADCHVLVALVVDDFSANLNAMKNDQIFQYLTQFLSRSFALNKGEVQLLQGKCTRWEEDPFVYGSYSGYIKGSSPEDCEILRRAVAGRVWMVGEHCSKDFIGSAHGAWRTGLQAAAEILTLQRRE